MKKIHPKTITTNLECKRIHFLFTTKKNVQQPHDKEEQFLAPIEKFCKKIIHHLSSPLKIETILPVFHYSRVCKKKDDGCLNLVSHPAFSITSRHPIF